MRGPLDLSRELLEAEVLHEFVHLPRRIDDAGELPEILDLAPGSCVTVRLYDSDVGLVAALVPAHTAIATSALAHAAGARAIRRTDPARVSAVTDCHPSLVAPVGLPRDVKVVADAGLRDEEVVYAATGDGSTALKIRSADLLALAGASWGVLVEPGAAGGAGAVEASWRGSSAGMPAYLR
jgi:prolyl-tRNA editing enzyme YbaK/EbsC (Cys-tRNA(Pro) deacylase)